MKVSIRQKMNTGLRKPKTIEAGPGKDAQKGDHMYKIRSMRLVSMKTVYTWARGTRTSTVKHRNGVRKRTFRVLNALPEISTPSS